eukprot:1159161-Pelagomonas_calceolata.AAC.8
MTPCLLLSRSAASGAASFSCIAANTAFALKQAQKAQNLSHLPGRQGPRVCETEHNKREC